MPKEFLSDAEMMALEKAGHAKPVSRMESLGRGALQGATMGFSDELVGAGEAALDKMRGSDTPLAEAYRTHRDESRLNNQQAQEDNPGTYLAGNLAGGVGSTIATGGAGLGIKGGALIGAASGLGGSDADLTTGDVGGAAMDTAKGAGVGAALGGAARLLSKGGVQGLKKSAENMADSAFNTSGVGRELLDSGAVNPLRSAESKLARINEAIDPLKSAKNAMLDADKSTYSPRQLADSVKNKIGMAKTDNEAASLQKVFNEVDSAAQRAQPEVDARYIDDIQHNMGTQAKFNKATFASPGDEFASKGFRDAYGTYGDALKTNNPGLADLNHKMTGLINAQDSIGSRNLNPATLLTKTGVAKSAIRNMDAIGAVTTDKVAKILQSTPQVFRQFAGVLTQAANRSPESLKATIHVLMMSDPEFRQMTQETEDQ